MLSTYHILVVSGWNNKIISWIPQKKRRDRGRTITCWYNHIKRVAELNWIADAQNRELQIQGVGVQSVLYALGF